MRAQARVGLPILQLDERLTLEALLPLTLSRARATGAYASDSRAVEFSVVPSLRLEVRGPLRLAFHGDVGAGIAHVRYRFNLPTLGEAHGSDTGLALRVAAGASYGFGSHWRVFVEPLSLTLQTTQEGVFRFGNTQFSSSTGAGSRLSVLAGATYAF